ncbi:Uncharacterised protein [Mycobacteroides abscessus subsp. abscessus]|nr:Uncharacterised protein [Mycobacteroides abscessus subsp. abscessus]
MTTNTLKPSACPWVARVAMMSSASNPSSASTVMPRAWSTSLVMSICPRNSSGVADRVALYSGYRSDRNVLRETSKAAATCVGASSRSRLINIEVNPYTALVVKPDCVLKFSAGSA